MARCAVDWCARLPSWESGKVLPSELLAIWKRSYGSTGPMISAVSDVQKLPAGNIRPPEISSTPREGRLQ